jgi:myo-inositol catabolism protein IolS
LLTGKFAPGHKFDADDNRVDNKLFQGKNFERAHQALEKLRPIAARHNCTLAQLAIAWLIAQPQTHVIVGARYAEQVTANAAAATVKLDDTELQQIDTIGSIVTSHLDENPLMWNWSQKTA